MRDERNNQLCNDKSKTIGSTTALRCFILQKILQITRYLRYLNIRQRLDQVKLSTC
jgi:hypothetical protein